MTRLLVLLSLSLVILLAGCTTLVHIPRESLREPSISSSIELRDDFSLPVKIGPLSSISRLGLEKGTYTAAYEDANGTFYRGKEWCLRVYRNDETTPRSHRNGGVWIPKNPTRFRPRIFAHNKGYKELSSSSATDAQSTVIANAASIGSPTPVQAGVGGAIASLIIPMEAHKDSIFFWVDIPTDAGLERELGTAAK